MKKRFSMVLTFIVFTFVLLCGCSVKDTTTEASIESSTVENSEPLTQASSEPLLDASNKSDTVDDRELIIAGREIAVGLNPTVPIVADYLVNMGAAELLFKANADGEIVPSLAQEAKEMDATTWEITLRKEAKFWSGKAVDADAVIASLEHSREVDLKAKPFLEGMSFFKLDDYTIRVKTTMEHMTVPLNLSYLQLVIHNVEEPYTLVDPKTTATNLALLKCFGAKVIVVTQQDESGSYHKTRIALANRLAREIPNSFRPDQCFNLLNSEAHYKSTAREIFEDCPEGITAIIAAVSTGGQLGGISRYLKTYKPEIKVIGVDAVGSAVFGGNTHPYRIPGIGLAWTPNNIKIEYIDQVYKVSDEQAFVAARCFARNEGILMGPSSGACALVALKLAQQSPPSSRIVCITSDGGERYMQTLFDDEWMQNQGFTVKTDLETLRTLSAQVVPWSTYPTQNANYKPELENSLEIPQTTYVINNDISRGTRPIERAVFID